VISVLPEGQLSYPDVDLAGNVFVLWEVGEDNLQLLAVWVEFTASDRRLQMVIPETECPHVNYIMCGQEDSH